MQELEAQIRAAVKKLFDVAIEVEFERPEEKHGDYSTNVALKLAGPLAKPPKDIAEDLAAELEQAKDVAKVEVAGPGFLNFWMDDSWLAKALETADQPPKKLSSQEILVEFGDPNPFKEMHIGHAYSYIVGDAISSLLEAVGAKVHRLSYHGDIGLHVAKALWGMQKEQFDPQRMADKSESNIGHYYALGAKAYEQDAAAKIEIDHINQHIYTGGGGVNELYTAGRKSSFAQFDQILADLEIHQAKRFLESDSAKKGLELVEAYIGKVFEKSNGAIVYKGEKVGLHTRVFITSAGLPTYEAKDLGLVELKKAAYPDADRSIVITAHEQAEYFKVMLAALKEFDPETANATTHLYHGFVSLSTGKMSSRTGEVYSAANLISDVDEAVIKTFKEPSKVARNAAIKYGFLKHRLGGDIVYDVTESVSLEGNSGPYLQYAHARACSILAKTENKPGKIADLESGERSLARKISEFPDVAAKAADEMMPHHACAYLYELAQAFNRFYEHNRVINDKREATRLALVAAYAAVLKTGLTLLNIEAPERI